LQRVGIFFRDIKVISVVIERGHLRLLSSINQYILTIKEAKIQFYSPLEK